MVDFRKLSDKAKDLVEKRGGTDALKQDATELKEIARGKGTVGEKARRAAEALKEPGERGSSDPAATRGAGSKGRGEPAGKGNKGAGAA